MSTSMYQEMVVSFFHWKESYIYKRTQNRMGCGKHAKGIQATPSKQDGKEKKMETSSPSNLSMKFKKHTLPNKSTGQSNNNLRIISFSFNSESPLGSKTWWLLFPRRHQAWYNEVVIYIFIFFTDQQSQLERYSFNSLDKMQATSKRISHRPEVTELLYQEMFGGLLISLRIQHNSPEFYPNRVPNFYNAPIEIKC